MARFCIRLQKEACVERICLLMPAVSLSKCEHKGHWAQARFTHGCHGGHEPGHVQSRVGRVRARLHQHTC